MLALIIYTRLMSNCESFLSRTICNVQYLTWYFKLENGNIKQYYRVIQHRPGMILASYRFKSCLLANVLNVIKNSKLCTNLSSQLSK